MGLMAQDVQAALQTHSLPRAPFIGTRYEAIEPNGEIEEWMSLDYSRFTALDFTSTGCVARRLLIGGKQKTACKFNEPTLKNMHHMQNPINQNEQQENAYQHQKS